MLERVLISLVIVLLALSAFALARGLHMISAGRATAGRTRPALLYFRSDSCGPCIAQGRYFEQLRASFGAAVDFEKIDADVDQERAARYGIFTVPTTLVVDRAGAVRHINYGLADTRKLEHQLRDVAVPPSAGTG